ncbi:MAG: pyrophosphatase [bacterium]|nr:MAG: pyrophosphatase [bacterium]
MATLKEKPTLPEIQEYIKEICKERNWDKNNHLEIFLLFTEEIGELAKAIRKHQGLYDEKVKEKNVNLEEEFADVFSYLLDLANYFNIDLEKAFRNKDKINSSRKWD